MTLRFEAQAADHAPAFTTAAQGISTRAREPGSVDWSPPPWPSVGAAGPDQRTPNLASLVQAVVDRPGWASGNALALIVTGSGTGKRTASSFNGNPAGAALLHVEYSFVDVNDPPTLSILSPGHRSQVLADEAAPLVALASDPEDGPLDDVIWISSRDGIIGQGASTSRILSVGIHTISAHVYDSEGLEASASKDVQVTADGLTVLTAGDIASCNSPGDEATAALLDEHFGDVITLGDNAYVDGTAAQFQNCYGPSWGRHKDRTHPAPGNHDYHIEGAAGYFDYFGEVAGDPSEGWYSYDLGAWHVVVLNSNCSEIGGCTRTSPQGLWLEADLAANPRDCTLAVWHHARFSSGNNHGSNTATRDFYDILHGHQADVVLVGHDHNYERFAPQDAFGIADPTGPRAVRGRQRWRHPAAHGRDRAELGHERRQHLRHPEARAARDLLRLAVPARGRLHLHRLGQRQLRHGRRTGQRSAGCLDPGTGAWLAVRGRRADHLQRQRQRSGGRRPQQRPQLDLEPRRRDRQRRLLHELGAPPARTRSRRRAGLGRLAGARPYLDHGDDAHRVMIEQRIAATPDDVEEEDGGAHDVSLASLDLELVEDARTQIVGLRYPGLTIPRGTRILDAWLQFQADGSSSGATSLSIQAEAVDDAPAFTRTARNVSSRALGSASVAWALRAGPRAPRARHNARRAW